MTTPPGSSTRWPLRSDSATSIAPRGSTPTARAAANAAIALRRRWAGAKGSSSPPTEATSPPSPKVTIVTSSRRWGASSGSPAGSTAVPPGGRPATSSAFAAATASTVPISSRWTGPTETITPTSGSAISASSAIWPAPRMPISSTRTSVSPGASKTVSGNPMSVLRFWRVATVRRWGRSMPNRMSLVDVLPVDPVMPITFALSARRQAVESAWSARSGSSAASSTPGWAHRAASACSGATSTPHAPAASACAANLPPSTFSPGRPTNSSPARTSRESIVARAGPPECGAGATSRAPAASATCSGDQSRMQCLAGDLDVVERHLHAVGELLALLVALAGDQHDLARLRQADRVVDRLATIDDRRRAAGGALQDLGDDRLGGLRARVVGRHDRHVGALGGHAPHQRPLAAISITTATEDADHPRGGQFTGCAQHVLQRIGRVGVVDEHGERLTFVHRLETH